MTRNVWCQIQPYEYNNYYYYTYPAFHLLPKISFHLKKVVFYTIYVNHLFYLSKYHKNIGVTFSGDCECPFTIQAILTGPCGLNHLVQIKPICKKLSFWITNSAMGSESINPKIQ